MNKPLHDPRARHAPVPGTVVAMSLSPAPAARRLRSLCLAASLTTALAACTTPPPAPPPPPSWGMDRGRRQRGAVLG